MAYERRADGSIGPTIPGVAIKFVSENGLVTKTTTTNSTGFYRIDMDVARYVVTAQHPDYENYSTAPGFFVVIGGSYQTGNIFLKKSATTTSTSAPAWKITGGAHLIGHTDIINSVAFSPDGNLLSSGSMDRTVKIWDVRTRACLRTLTSHTSWVRAVAFSPDGRILASAGDDKPVRLWDPQTGAALRVLTGHYSGVFAVAFSPDGRTLVSVSPVNKGELIHWDVQTGALLKRIAINHTTMVRTLAFSSDGRTVATVGGNPNVPGEIKVWDISAGTLVKAVTGHASLIEGVTFSPDAALLATAGGLYDNALLIWDAKTLATIKTLPHLDQNGMKSGLKAVAFSTDGKYSGVGGSVVRLYDRASWKNTLYLYPEHGVTHTLAFSPTFSPTNLMVATAGAKKLPLDKYIIQLWAISPADAPVTQPGLQLVSKHFFGGAGNQRGLGISVTGNRLYISGSDAGKFPGGQSLAAGFALPLTPGALPAWKTSWPDPSSSRYPDHEIFNGVASSDQGPYFGGFGWTQTSDNVGDKESKSVLVKFSPNGPTAGNAGGADWIAKPEFFRNYWGWEGLNATLASKEGDTTYIYATGRAQANGANNTAVLAKFNSSGKLVWSMALGDPGYTKNSGGNSLAIANGRVYVGGSSHYPYTDPTARRAILWTVDFSGGGKYAYSLPQPCGSQGEVVAAAAGSAVYVMSPIDNGPNGGMDVFIQKYDFSNSNYLGWGKVYGGPGDDIPHGLAVSADGKRLYGVGEQQGANTQGKDAVMVEIDAADGKQLSVSKFAGAQDDIARGVTVVGSDIYVVGESKSFGTSGSGFTATDMTNYVVGQSSSSGAPTGNAVGQNEVFLLRYQMSGAPTPPPVADAGPDQAVECDSYVRTRVQLDGSRSSDPQGLPLTYTWKWPSGGANGVKPVVYLPMGRHLITLNVSNGKLSASDSVAVLIRDMTPPVFRRLSVTPKELWPPNNKPVVVRADTIWVFDSCTLRPRIALVSIKTGPPHPGVKGPYVSDAYYGTDDRAFKLLAAKGTKGDSRVYTIVYRATDNAGNSSYDTAIVVVPHSKDKSDKSGGGGSGNDPNQSGGSGSGGGTGGSKKK